MTLSISEATIVDGAFYRASYASLLGTRDPAEHYAAEGHERGLMPSPGYDPLAARIAFPNLEEDERVARVRTTGLDAIMTPIVRDVLAMLETSDAFSWRFADTQAERDHLKRPASTLAAWDRIDEPGSIPFRAGGKSFSLRKRSPEEMRALLQEAKPCAMPRLPHGFLDMTGRLFEIVPRIRSKWPAIDSEDKAIRLGIRILRQLYPKNPVLLENMIPEVLEILSEEAGTFPVCLALKAHPDIPDRLFGTADPSPHRHEAALSTITRSFPDGFVFEDGIGWKRYASTGRIGMLIEAMRSRKVVLIANAGFRALGERWQLPDFHHIEIPPKDSQAIRYRLADDIAEQFVALGVGAHGEPPAIVLTQAGGSFAFWLIHRLRQRFANVAYIDIGQAINIWFLDDPATGKPEMLWLQDFWEQVLEANDLFSFYDRVLGVKDSRAELRRRHFDGTLLARLPSHGGDLDFANLLLKYDLPERALVFAERARERTPAAAPLYVVLARLYRKAGRTEEALAAAQKAVALDSSKIVAKQILATTLFDMQRYSEFFQVQESIGDRATPPARQMSIAYEKLGDIENAVAVLKRALDQAQTPDPALIKRLEILREKLSKAR